jgi:hypothetical protein
MDAISFKLAVVALSELVAAWIIWRLWRSEEHVFFKASLSILALIPVVGPLFAIWIGNFPDKVPSILQDRYRYSSDVFDRWRHVHSEPNPKRRLQKWIAFFKRHRNEES